MTNPYSRSLYVKKPETVSIMSIYTHLGTPGVGKQAHARQFARTGLMQEPSQRFGKPSESGRGVDARPSSGNKPKRVSSIDAT
jgi:hypothetical protein